MYGSLPTSYKNAFHIFKNCLTEAKFTLKTLQSIIGTLIFACAVVLPGRAFLRRLIDLTTGVSKPHFFHPYQKGSAGTPTHMGRIPCQLQREDHLHSRTMVVVNQPEPVHRCLWSSWLWGSAGLILVLQSMVSAVGQSESNTAGALPHCPGCAVWGNRLANGRIIFHTDNQALVPIINKQSSKDKAIMCLVRKLLITCLRFNILFQAQHIAGKANVSQTTCHVYKSAPSWQKRLWHRGSQKQFLHFLTCQSDNYTCSTDGLRFSTSFTGLLSTGMGFVCRICTEVFHQ